MKLSEFDIRYELRIAIKVQAPVDFLAEMVYDRESRDSRWILYVDGASRAKRSWASVILEKASDIIVELSMKFDFPISNNQVEYEALIEGLWLASNVGATRLMICSDS